MQDDQEWLLFSEKKSKQLFCLLKDLSEEPQNALKDQIINLLKSTVERVETIYPQTVRILDPIPLTLLLIAMRNKEYKELEIPLCKNIEEIGKGTLPHIYKAIGITCKKLPNEGWVYYAVKDIAGNRRKEAKGIAKCILSAIWEDTKDHYQHWNALYNYTFTPYTTE
ncbi:hypothetical protein NEIRO03_0544 [Nematocida sp. AWRm78]|nr:hypothetical protein NEIRO02_1196 [Nematocida sp. AWRm79]KAI5182904.1 hypothetical protein NEIRO03_0544 [Nematocida sp. AWRm78]